MPEHADILFSDTGDPSLVQFLLVLLVKSNGLNFKVTQFEFKSNLNFSNNFENHA